MNIILVVFDSLRKDCVGAYGAQPWGVVQTPHFDALAQLTWPATRPTLPDAVIWPRGYECKALTGLRRDRHHSMITIGDDAPGWQSPGENPSGLERTT